MTDHEARAQKIARCVRGCTTDDQYQELTMAIATALREAYAAGVEDAAKAGWNACRKSIYAVCEDAASEGDGHRSDTDNAPRHHFGRGFMAAAKSIARGFNSMEAEHDGNFRAAIRALIPAKED